MTQQETLLTVARTLRQLAFQGIGEKGQKLLLEVADQVESSTTDDLAYVCPVCEETTCDEGCPLEAIRKPLINPGASAGRTINVTALGALLAERFGCPEEDVEIGWRPPDDGGPPRLTVEIYGLVYVEDEDKDPGEPAPQLVWVGRENSAGGSIE